METSAFVWHLERKVRPSHEAGIVHDDDPLLFTAAIDILSCIFEKSEGSRSAFNRWHDGVFIVLFWRQVTSVKSVFQLDAELIKQFLKYIRTLTFIHLLEIGNHL